MGKVQTVAQGASNLFLYVLAAFSISIDVDIHENVNIYFQNIQKFTNTDPRMLPFFEL